MCAEVKKELQKSGQAGKISIRVTQPMSRSLARKNGKPNKVATKFQHTCTFPMQKS